MKKTTPLKVGFDLDGVLLYNPARIIRPLLKSGKSLILKRKKPSFYIPQTQLQKLAWQLAHKSSMFTAPGVNQIETLADQNKIEAYIITARFECLESDYQKWVKKLNQNQAFSQTFYNHQNLQPHIFKEKMIKQLKLEVFVEDNWDIVKYLNSRKSNLPFLKRIFWISNIFDTPIQYQYKCKNLKSAMEAIEEYTNNI